MGSTCRRPSRLLVALLMTTVTACSCIRPVGNDSSATASRSTPAKPRFFLYDCPACDVNLRYPPPGTNEQARLDEIVAEVAPPMAPGDKVVICNRWQCVTYQYTDNAQWDGVESRWIQGSQPR